MIDINTFIPSFGDFMVSCRESDIENDLFNITRKKKDICKLNQQLTSKKPII